MPALPQDKKSKRVATTTTKTKGKPKNNNVTKEPAPVVAAVTPAAPTVDAAVREGKIEELLKLSVNQLKSICRERQIVGYSGKRKDAIIDMLLAPPSPPGTEKKNK